MEKIIEFLYDLVKKYVTKKAEDTENQEFIDKCNSAFTVLEDIWEIVSPTIKK